MSDIQLPNEILLKIIDVCISSLSQCENKSKESENRKKNGMYIYNIYLTCRLFHDYIRYLDNRLSKQKIEFIKCKNDIKMSYNAVSEDIIKWHGSVKKFEAKSKTLYTTIYDVLRNFRLGFKHGKSLSSYSNTCHKFSSTDRTIKESWFYFGMKHGPEYIQNYISVFRSANITISSWKLGIKHGLKIKLSKDINGTYVKLTLWDSGIKILGYKTSDKNETDKFMDCFYSEDKFFAKYYMLSNLYAKHLSCEPIL